MISVAVVVTEFGWGTANLARLKVGTCSQCVLQSKAQGGNTAHAPCEFACKLTEHDQGGGGQLLADVHGACVCDREI